MAAMGPSRWRQNWATQRPMPPPPSHGRRLILGPLLLKLAHSARAPAIEPPALRRQLAMQRTSVPPLIIPATPTQVDQPGLGLGMFGRFGVLGQVLRPVSQVQLLIDDGGLAQPLHRAPMHLGIDEPLRALDRLRDVLGDWPVEGQEAADEPASVGPVEGAC